MLWRAVKAHRARQPASRAAEKVDQRKQTQWIQMPDRESHLGFQMMSPSKGKWTFYPSSPNPIGLRETWPLTLTSLCPPPALLFHLGTTTLTFPLSLNMLSMDSPQGVLAQAFASAWKALPQTSPWLTASSPRSNIASSWSLPDHCALHFLQSSNGVHDLHLYCSLSVSAS